ncbi:MAG TPA: hypothetical protein VFV08_09025, partial [Puia sp.]|nr:hypothetical protein [Puia sp.]
MKMHNGIQYKNQDPSLLERFGIYYLRIFRKKDLNHHVFDLSDRELTRRVDKISLKGSLLSMLVGIIFVLPIVYIDLLKANEPWYVHYGWTIGVSVVASAIELYFLFIIALRVVHEVSELINMHAHTNEFLKSGPFSVTNILSRTALELPDPELEILGIDPFERISKKNLLILGLLYKLKIVITNYISKFLLRTFIGKTIAGVSINYIALPVECFWNAMVIRRVVKEARLRMFGFALCNYIADEVIHDKVLDQLSKDAVDGCMRAIGNAVVMAQNYHPNMIILLLRFEHLLHVDQARRFDDWNLFLET